jgi:hypothetical protein
MNRDDIIRMAREAGIPIETDWAGRASTLVIKDGGTYLRGVDDLERFAALVAAEKEREMQDRVDALHAMYEQACRHRDQLMDAQRATIAAMRSNT